MSAKSLRLALVAALAVSATALLVPTGASALVRGIFPDCKIAVTAASAVPRQAPTVRLGRAAVCLVNRHRAARGMAPLRINRRLSRAARRHTRDMVRRDYFAHTSPRGSDMLSRIRRTGYLRGPFSWTVGENLAWGSGWRGSPHAIVQAWMHSSGHRHNMLNPRYREIGIGVVAAAPGYVGTPAATYTTTFGIRR